MFKQKMIHFSLKIGLQKCRDMLTILPINRSMIAIFCDNLKGNELMKIGIGIGILTLALTEFISHYRGKSWKQEPTFTLDLFNKAMMDGANWAKSRLTNYSIMKVGLIRCDSGNDRCHKEPLLSSEELL